jgi:uncharacterized protein (DUF2252 family)
MGQESAKAAHTVLASAGPTGYASLRTTPTPREERYALGRALRHEVPRKRLGDWNAPAGRPDPVTLVIEAHEGRQNRLISLRVGRMVASPYAFLRGTAAIMAEDFSRVPATGITPVICGDAHLGNFGFYASPERALVFDLNDFDEAHPGRWEWDLRRLTASVHVAGRINGASENHCADAVVRCVAAYREQVWDLSGQPLLARSFMSLDVDRLRETVSDESLRDDVERSANRARKRTSDRALPKLTALEGGQHRIVEEPPIITRLTDSEYDEIAEALDVYLTTLPPHWRRLVAGYTLLDIAHKVVGVGSVGLRAYVALCEGSSPDDALFLQLKEARRSVVARFVHGDSAWHQHQGQRVVEYQQALQTVSDPLLGWTSFGGRQYYVRQFRDMKGAITVDDLGPQALADYAGVCGLLLAKGHSRTSGASMIAGYLGRSEKADRAFARFARRYADQIERDHERLVAAVNRGLLPAEYGV